ncbi:flagellar hook-length control protein FliK [Pseudomonas sp. SCB32]|uniref:flagellar hook-length control protein FliK n=1 Tax=Pseudomonas sp. SCB32 TaxID=2653853 RepID=UPI001264F1D3|nr:flagellar hook-length control protein FliK [Pseudomonas sp. SCB32]
MTQPIPVVAAGGDRPVADARAAGSAVAANVSGSRAQQGQANAEARTITVQSFLTQFDTAQTDDSAQPASSAQPVLPEAVTPESADADASTPPAQEASPSGAENWLAGMLSQAGLIVQARDNPPAETSARVAGFATQATQAVESRAQPAPSAVPPEDVLLPPAEPQDDAGKPTAPAPRETTQSQAQTLLQQHLAAASATPDATAPQLPSAAVDVRLPGSDGSAPANAQASTTPLFDKLLHLKGDDAHWGEQMVTALRDNVELQLGQRVQNATIRLDPPELGAMEILVRHEAGQLNVQISASHGEVVRMLQQTSERLRQELVGHNFLQVNVQVSADSGQNGQQNRQRFEQEQLAVSANPRDAQVGERAAPRGDSDVLITV